MEETMTHEEFEAEVARLLAEEADSARPDRRGLRGNGDPDHDDVAEGWAKLRRVLG
jgi:hypothetical protein